MYLPQMNREHLRSLIFEKQVLQQQQSTMPISQRRSSVHFPPNHPATAACPIINQQPSCCPYNPYASLIPGTDDYYNAHMNSKHVLRIDTEAYADQSCSGSTNEPCEVSSFGSSSLPTISTMSSAHLTQETADSSALADRSLTKYPHTTSVFIGDDDGSIHQTVSTSKICPTLSAAISTRMIDPSELSQAQFQSLLAELTKAVPQAKAAVVTTPILSDQKPISTGTQFSPRVATVTPIEIREKSASNPDLSCISTSTTETLTESVHEIIEGKTHGKRPDASFHRKVQDTFMSAEEMRNIRNVWESKMKENTEIIIKAQPPKPVRFPPKPAPKPVLEKKFQPRRFEPVVVSKPEFCQKNPNFLFPVKPKPELRRLNTFQNDLRKEPQVGFVPIKPKMIRPVHQPGRSKNKKFMDRILEEVELAKAREEELRIERGLSGGSQESSGEETILANESDDSDDYQYSKDSPALYKGPLKPGKKSLAAMTPAERIRFEIEEVKAKEKELRENGLLRGHVGDVQSDEGGEKVRAYWQSGANDANVEATERRISDPRDRLEKERQIIQEREDELRALRGIAKAEDAVEEADSGSHVQRIAYFNKLSGHESDPNNPRSQKTTRTKKLAMMWEHLASGGRQ